MSDLPTQLRDAITAKLELARAATEGPWRLVDHGTTFDGPSWVLEDVERFRAGMRNNVFFGSDEATARYVAAHSPDIVIRRCERDLRVLDRHAPCSDFGHEDLKPHCHHCWVDWPCPDIVDLAYDLGIPTKEETT